MESFAGASLAINLSRTSSLADCTPWWRELGDKANPPPPRPRPPACLVMEARDIKGENHLRLVWRCLDVFLRGVDRDVCDLIGLAEGETLWLETSQLFDFNL